MWFSKREKKKFAKNNYSMDIVVRYNEETIESE